MSGGSLVDDLSGLGVGARLPTRHDLHDATELRGIVGRADAVALPVDTEQVASVVAHCSERGIPLTPRGGGTGFAGGAVPDGGVVLAMEGMRAVRSLDAETGHAEVEAGLSTSELDRRARESGRMWPVDPGAAESSQIGGNVATNAGGPHAYRYGTTGAWVEGLEAVVCPGSVVRLGGRTRKDVAPYDLVSLLVGSEGTLAVITAVTLALPPRPEARLPVAAFHASAERGCEAIRRVIALGIDASALEFLDAGALRAAAASFPADVPAGAEFLVLADADGDPDTARRIRAELSEAIGEGALGLHVPEARREVEDVWRWRGGVSHAVAALRGGKVSEDVCVPVERLGDAVAATVEIGSRHGLQACSWGHGGDGNIHSTFLVDATSGEDLAAAERAARELFEMALELGGSISGEHGIGSVKRGWLERQLGPVGIELHRGVKRLLDPDGILNPGKKD